MSKQWKTIVDEDLDNQLQTIKQQEGFKSRSETAREVMSEGVRRYNTGIVDLVVEKATLLAFLAAVMSLVMYVGLGAPRLLETAALCGGAGVLFGIVELLRVQPTSGGSLLKRQGSSANRVITDGGGKE